MFLEQKNPYVFSRPNALVISSPVLKASLARCETFDTSSHSEFHKRITAAQYAAPALLFFPIYMSEFVLNTFNTSLQIVLSSEATPSYCLVDRLIKRIDQMSIFRTINQAKHSHKACLAYFQTPQKSV